DEFISLRLADPYFEPARAVLVGTVRGDAPLPRIEDRITAQVADLFNVAYEITILALARLFAHTDETPDQLKVLEKMAVGLMVGTMAPLGELLTRLPFGPSYPGMMAAPTFELSFQSAYLHPHRGPAWRVIEERLRQGAEFARRIERTDPALSKTATF